MNHDTFDRENVFWFSLIEKINKKLRFQDDKIATITSVEGMLYVLFLYHIGLLPFFPIKDKVFGVTVEEVNKTKFDILIFSLSHINEIILIYSIF